MSLQQIINMIRQGGNPQQIVMSLLQSKANNNENMQNLLLMANNNNSQGIEDFARNLLQSQGRDFDAEFNSFKQNLFRH